MLVHNARDVGLFHAAAPARLAARRKDPLPTLEPADVLPEGLAQELAPAATLSTSHPIDLTRESRGKRDRYRPRRRHVVMLTQCLTSLRRSDLAIRLEPRAAQRRAVLLQSERACDAVPPATRLRPQAPGSANLHSRRMPLYRPDLFSSSSMNITTSVAMISATPARDQKIRPGARPRSKATRHPTRMPTQTFAPIPEKSLFTLDILRRRT